MAAELPLGKRIPYPREYAPSVLAGIPRDEGRAALGLTGVPPFAGVDLWNAHELSWLDTRGKPVVATAELWVPATSPRMVESKSLKLYLDSLNGMRHESAGAVRRLITTDVQRVVGAELEVRIELAAKSEPRRAAEPKGTCLDDADASIDVYDVAPELLEGSADPGVEVEETLYSHLLKSNCPVTGQPDWATVSLRYRGGRIDRTALLRYIVSYRNHDEFHEQCVERIFVDVQRQCHPSALTVFARYNRRGGIDINPFRSDFETLTDNVRAWRQ